MTYVLFLGKYHTKYGNPRYRFKVLCISELTGKGLDDTDNFCSQNGFSCRNGVGVVETYEGFSNYFKKYHPETEVLQSMDNWFC